METEEDDFGAVSSLGLNRILADSGIDPAAFSSFFSKTGGGQSSSAFAQVEVEDDPEKYEDDVSDSELPAESAEEAQLRRKRAAEEDRWYRRARDMQRRAEGGAEKRKRKQAQMAVGLEEQVKRIWPEFEMGKRLKMSEVFYETPAQVKNLEVVLGKNKKRPRDKVEHRFKVTPRSEISPLATYLQSSLAQLHSSIPGRPRYDAPIGANFDPRCIKLAKTIRRRDMTKPPPDVNLNQPDAIVKPEKVQSDPQSEDLEKPLDLADWERDIVMCTLEPPVSKREHQPLAPRNDLLESGKWTSEIVWDARRISPGLIESDDEPTPTAPADTKKSTARGANVKLDRFNLSNDHLYEHTRESRLRIRQTFGAIEVFHSAPAKALQMPFYKTTLAKTEARAWRRPALQFPIGITLSFSKLKSNPSASVSTKKKAMMADPSERFKSTKDLTMAEKGPYVLLEFSEEYPPIMSGYGMGTTIVNYYRKKDDKDEHVPKLDCGQPSILNVGDAEPFLLGYVDRGAVTQVIHNNLLRAPIFRHQPQTTDFLVIRQTINGHATYHIRAINNLYTVGQTVPNESEVPGPHARKNTSTAKQRLMIVAWLLIQKSKSKRIKLGRLMKYFPDQTELQMRQRLKIKGNEFLVFARQPGPNQGHWMLNPEYDFPTNRKDVLERCTPEAAMLYEAMQVGARHLHDAGYSKTAEGKEEEEMGDDSTLDIEQQLAVWSTTLNYKRAEAQKAWLVVHGDGDPTGRGEGFSFLRTNMKSYFLRKGETEVGRRIEDQNRARGDVVKISNSQQQQIYEEEKRKVWDLQWKALGNPVPPELSPDDEVERIASTPAGFGPRFGRADSRRARSRGDSMAATPALESPRDVSPSALSGDGESTYTGNAGAGKVMRIKRVVKGKEQVEIVRDPAVIRSYMKRIEEQKLAYYMKNPDLLAPSGDAEEDEIKKAAIRMKLEQVKKNQARRLARKKSLRGELEVYEGDETGKRRCGACGQIGHTRANRMCPMFSANSVGPSPAGTTPLAPTPGGFGSMGFAPVDGSMPPPQGPESGSTSFKIRLGTGNRG